MCKENFNRYTIFIFIILCSVFAGYKYYLMKEYEKRYKKIRVGITEKIHLHYPNLTVVIDPLQQTKAETGKRETLLNFYIDNSNIRYDFNKIFNELFVILNKYGISLSLACIKQNSIGLTGEANSIGELDKLKIDIINNLSLVEDVKIINSKYKGIISL